MSGPRVRIGIVGAGIWGRNHALALAGHAPAELAIVCDRDEARARQLAEKYGCAWTTSLDELAASDVHAVTIATPDHLHAAPTLLMLGAGKHVLVEKPLATTVADARRMVDAAEAAGVRFMVDFHARWHPLFMGAKEYVESGKVGDPVLAYARLSDTIYVPTEMLPWAGDSGPEWFLFPHVMDVVRWILGSEPVEVFARGHRGVLEGRGIHCWDAIQALFEFANGAICTFETAWVLPNSYTNVVDNRLSLVGSRGGLELRNEPNLWAFTDRFHTPFSSESVTRYGKAWGFQYESIRYFVDCVAAGVTPEAGGRDGLAATAMIEASLRSLREHRAVRMDEVLG